MSLKGGEVTGEGKKRVAENSTLLGDATRLLLSELHYLILVADKKTLMGQVTSLSFYHHLGLLDQWRTYLVRLSMWSNYEECAGEVVVGGRGAKCPHMKVDLKGISVVVVIEASNLCNYVLSY